MVNGVGNGGGIARDAIRAAMERQAEAQKRLESVAQELQPATGEVQAPSDFQSNLAKGVSQLEAQVQMGDSMVDGIVTGKVSDFHEVAAQVKQADLSFKFAMAVRNKFIDAYREVMRMSV